MKQIHAETEVPLLRESKRRREIDMHPVPWGRMPRGLRPTLEAGGLLPQA